MLAFHDRNAHVVSVYRSIILIQILLFLLLFVVLLRSPHHLVYDEVNSVPSIASFHALGVTPQYLNSLRHASGPLYGAFYGALSPVTRDDVYRLRFVNYLLLCIFTGLLVWLLQRVRFPFSVPLACAVIAIPTVWVCSGIALDEMLGFVFLTLGFIPISIDVFDSGVPVWNRALRFFLAGIAFGLASLVRQPFIVASVAIPIAAIMHRRNVASALLTPTAAILILAPVLVTWRGLTPPLVGSHAGLSVEHGAFSLAYGGLFSFIIAPRFFRFGRWQVLAAALSSIIANSAFCIVTVQPARSLAFRVLPATIFKAYGLVCGDILLAVALMYALSVTERTFECGRDSWRLAVHCGLILLLVWPTVMKAQFSSRYPLMAAPFMILAAKDYYNADLFTLVRTLVGGVGGALVLWTYYH